MDEKTKRFKAACAAMQGFVSDYKTLKQYNKKYPMNYIEQIISDSYKMADEMIKQENK